MAQASSSICNFCGLAMLTDTHTEDCGHELCEPCVSSSRGPGEAWTCPVCLRENADGDMGTQSAETSFADEVAARTKAVKELVRTQQNLAIVLYEGVRRIETRVAMLETEMRRVPRAQDEELKGLRVAVQAKNTSFNGVLFWKIDNVERRFTEAQADAHSSVLSPPFFTSRAGYKLRARLYLNGDGIGQGQYLSLFIVMMKGKYDNLVTWPFNQLVTFTLMDQSGPGQHVEDSFRPDPTSTSFQRPRTEMNIASGCPRFMNLSDFRARWSSFVNGSDELFIKVEVDTQELENFGGQSA